MKLNYAIVCYKDNEDGETMEIKHTCCYENEPNDEDVKSLVKELAEDEEFGMIGDSDYRMVLLDRSVSEESDLMDSLDIPHEIEEE
jgi:hypothetical protein